MIQEVTIAVCGGVALFGLTYLVTKEVTRDSTLRREILLSIRYTFERVFATLVALWLARKVLGL